MDSFEKIAPYLRGPDKKIISGLVRFLEYNGATSVELRGSALDKIEYRDVDLIVRFDHETGTEQDIKDVMKKLRDKGRGLKKWIDYFRKVPFVRVNTTRLGDEDLNVYHFDVKLKEPPEHHCIGTVHNGRYFVFVNHLIADLEFRLSPLWWERFP